MSYKIVKSWITKTGLDACILLVNNSHHCGYVAIPDALLGEDFYENDTIVAHGGITYQGVPEWSQGKEVIGFDCAHWNDLTHCPQELIDAGLEHLHTSEGVWRDEEYCVNECESMAEQLINLVPKIN